MSVDFCHETTVKKPRKACRCWFCGELLPPGFPHQKRAGVSEGDFWGMRFHAACGDFARDVLKYDYDDYEFHDVHEFCERLKKHGFPKEVAP